MKKIKKIILLIIRIRLFLRMEFKKNRSLGSMKFVKNAKNGFFSISSILYEFEKNNKEDYLSDWARLSKASKLNDSRKIIIDDKLLFHTMNRNNIHVKPIVAVTKSKRIYKINLNSNEFIEIENQVEFQKFVSQFSNGLIIKPHTGGGGGHISKVYLKENNFIFEGACNSMEDFYKKVVHSKADFLMTEIIKQTGSVHDIYPNALNTIRILTMFDPIENKPFIARAVQRFGTTKSGIVDNWTAGGICALIDIHTGKIKEGAPYPAGDRLEWCKIHPYSNVTFFDMKIPNWEKISNYILKLSQEYYFIPYIGWDVVPMEDGFFILEGNANSDVNLLQIHGGLLKERKMKSFYKYHNVI